MKINKEYLKEFCDYCGIFDGIPLTPNNIIRLTYNFGVKKENLKGIKNMRELEETINKHWTLSSKDIHSAREAGRFYSNLPN